MELISSHCFGIGKIIHKRTRDTDNFFQYNAPYLSINLSNTINIHPFISLNRFNFFSIFYKQHGFRNKKKSLYDFAKNVAEKHNIVFNSIQFICIPSIVGYSFNPISFYLYLDSKNQVKSIIYEVKNTFGDQVHYLTLNKFKDKEFKKNMYVSPFIEMDCTYKISSKNKRKNHFFCNINQFNLKKEQIFYASIDLNLKEITFYNFILFLILNIFGSVKTITLIHYQAIKLFLKKSKFFKYSNRIKDNLYLD